MNQNSQQHPSLHPCSLLPCSFLCVLACLLPDWLVCLFFLDGDQARRILSAGFPQISLSLSLSLSLLSMRCCRMPRFTSADEAPMTSKEARALDVLKIPRRDTLTTRIWQEARKVALLQNHPDKCGNPRVSCDDIMLACDTLKSRAAAGDQKQAFEEEWNGHIKAAYGEFFCDDPNCNEWCCPLQTAIEQICGHHHVLTGF